MNFYEEPQKTATNKTTSFFPKLEIPLVALACIAFIFKVQHWPLNGVLMVVSLAALSVLYFFLASKSDNPATNSAPLSVQKFGFYSCSVGAIALLYKLQHWPGAGQFMTIGGLAVLLALILSLAKESNRKNWIRLTIIFILLVLLHRFSSPGLQAKYFPDDAPAVEVQ